MNERLADEISRKLDGIYGQVLPSKPLDAALILFHEPKLTFDPKAMDLVFH